LKVNCPISIGELIDKISILEIKNDLIRDIDKNKNIKLELNILRDKVKKFNNYKLWLAKIKNVNKKIWKSVGEIWLCEKSKIYNKNFIKLARDIYILNDKRYKIKEKINNYYKSYIFEEKFY